MNKAFILSAMTLALTACGGGGSSSVTTGGPVVTNPPVATPPVVSTFSVNGNSYNAAGTGTKSTLTSTQKESARETAFTLITDTIEGEEEDRLDRTLTDAETQVIADNVGDALEASSIIDDVLDAHGDGWTGKGVNVGSIDGGGHGDIVEGLVKIIAPEVTFSEHDDQNFWDFAGNSNGDGSASSPYEVLFAGSVDLSNHDVLTTSSGLPILYAGEYQIIAPEEVTKLKNGDFVFTIAAQHSNWSDAEEGGRNTFGTYKDCTYGTDGSNMNIANCNTWYVSGVKGDHVIFVGEVEDDVIPEWSNKAGQGAVDGDYNFIVTESATTRSEAEGNSFAAPRVAGTAALIMHKFGTNNDDTVDIILLTADDLGAAGVDAVYGHGKLNVGAALSPVGDLD